MEVLSPFYSFAYARQYQSSGRSLHGLRLLIAGLGTLRETRGRARNRSGYSPEIDGRGQEDEMVNAERDPQRIDRLASAQLRLSEQERILAGRPLRGSRRPGPPARQPQEIVLKPSLAFDLANVNRMQLGLLRQRFLAHAGLSAVLADRGTKDFELLSRLRNSPVVMGRVSALEGGRARSGWIAANGGVRQYLDASV